MSNIVITLVADIVDSRKISERKRFNKELFNIIEQLNARNKSLVSPYTVTAGDEIQAVYCNADLLFHDAVFILAEIYPIRMRFSFGVGNLVTDINPNQAIAMDGPAFHEARDGIENILKKDHHLFTVSGDTIPDIALIRQILILISHNVKSWNKTRLKTLSMLFEKMPIKEIAEKTGLTDKAIYKTIQAGSLENIVKLFYEIHNKLNKSL